MANNYLQFSEIIHLQSGEERDWIKSHLEIFNLVTEDQDDNPNGDEQERIMDLYGLRGEELEFGFDWHFDDYLSQLHIYGEEFGNIDHVAIFAQEYLKKFHPDKAFCATWSVSCDQMEVGEFGGGAVFVTADEIQWMSAHDWRDKKWKEFKEKRGVGSRKQKRANG